MNESKRTPADATPPAIPGAEAAGPEGRSADQLRSRLIGKQARIGIIGLGYVGLPLARAFAEKGFRVIGFDIDAAKVNKLQRGESYIGHISDDVIAAMGRLGFEATDRFVRLDEPDAIMICVPTPLTETREPDLTYVINSTQAIAERLRPGQLVVLESTTYPGTTRQVVLPILESSGLKAGSDFFLAFSPEREDPGNQAFSAPTIPKVVGGLDPISLDLADAMYGQVVVRTVTVSSPEVAEACKILENTYRAVNIALVNELKILYDRMGIDVWEVIDAAKTKPFGYQAFYPGPGLGGHCLAGSETVRIRGRSLDTVIPLSDLYELCAASAQPFRLIDAEVIDRPGIETLSIDLQTNATVWKPVSFLFRRRFRGIMIDVQLAGNRTLRVTDRHPMLVVENGKLEVRLAKDLEPGDRVPQFNGRWEGVELLSVLRVTPSPADERVYSLEVPGTHTFATSGGVFVHNCIPIDPYYLTWVARKYGLSTRFIELAGEINTAMPTYVVSRVSDALNELGKPIKGSKITLLGMAYKKDVDDPRESPGFELMDLLLKKGAVVNYNDPHIPVLPPMRRYPHLRMASRELSPDYIRSQDCLLIVTDHTSYPWEHIAKYAPLIVDTRNALKGLGPESYNRVVRS